MNISPKNIVASDLCIGCGICVAISSNFGKRVQMKLDSYGRLIPNGPSQWMEQTSEIFAQTCPFSPLSKNEDELAAELFAKVQQKNVSIGRYISNWVGYAADDDFRMPGSSGGMTSWAASELIRKGLADGVGHVIPTEPSHREDRHFKYRISRTENEIKEGAKSRYYPVELSEILEEIKEIPGRYAIIAVPCMIKALQLLREQNPVFRERICFTLALVCGHMKSIRFVESLAWQMKIPFKDVKQVDFRYKIPERPANWYCAMLTTKEQGKVKKDWWHLVDGDWGAGFFMNPACNFCDDVFGETADVSLGDAWIEPFTSDGKGTNIVVVRSELMHQLILAAIHEGRLKLKEISCEIVEKTQAAGLRQRREGLSYRLLWAFHGIQPKKRVIPGSRKISKSRRLIYWMRFMISKWSHRMFWLARKMKKPAIYLVWARSIAAVYYGIAYHKGNWVQIKNRLNELKRQK